MSEDEAFKKLKRLGIKKLVLESLRRKLTKEISELEDKIADYYNRYPQKEIEYRKALRNILEDLESALEGSET